MSHALVRVWPPLPPLAWLRAPRHGLPFPLEEPGCGWFARGRHALWHGARALGLGPGDEVLVPAYHHGSEIEALGSAGLTPRYYAGDESLAPVEDELEALLRPPVRALLLIHYLGFPQDAAHWRRWCKGRDLLLLEDAAQAWLAVHERDPVGAAGDLAIFCLDKTLGLTDGALLAGPRAEPARRRDGSLAAATIAARHAAWVAGRSATAGRAFARLHRPAPYVAERDFALGEPYARPARATAPLVARLAGPEVAAERRANYRFLLSELGDRVPAPFVSLPTGAAPFAFPVTADDKPRLLERLRSAGIEALDFWSAPHASLPAAAFPEAALRRTRTIVLPVHQELRSADLEHIARTVRGPSRRQEKLRIEPIASLDAARGEWTELSERTGDPFATWEWADTWCRHFLAGRPLHLAACRRSDGRLAGILPLYESARGPLHMLRFLGSGPADRQGPICSAADSADVARALRRLLAGGHCDLLLAERLPGDVGWGRLLGAVTLRREASPVLRIDGRSWDELLAARSANFRQQVRARERRLTREFSVSFRLANDPERLPSDLNTLAALHSARWQAGGSDALSGPLRAFHEDFAALALSSEWLRLWFLELDGRPVAAWYGFRYGGGDWFYQAGREPRHEQLSVGFVLMAHTIREAARDGMRTYHLLRGDEPYKARFANEDPGIETVGLARDYKGRAAVAGASGAARLPAGRRALARLGG